jgi:hypothetical protein
MLEFGKQKLWKDQSNLFCKWDEMTLLKIYYDIIYVIIFNA